MVTEYQNDKRGGKGLCLRDINMKTSFLCIQPVREQTLDIPSTITSAVEVTDPVGLVATHL